ncbi:hypothetical protein GCM10022226_61720 [Sphaerisporangium flaviroseum]|uniref:Uncharacterized protein n=1 Tax=Sphaerisporangium flaviroseum TaxID=509199 RepID=A0ABP7J276_9ACTN
MNDSPAHHRSATLSLERTSDGGIIFQSWEICTCVLPQRRTRLGPPTSQVLATAEQAEATGRAVLSVDGPVHLGEGL